MKAQQEKALAIAYQAIMQVNMLAGPHSALTDVLGRLLRIRQITDKALKTLNSEHTETIQKAVFKIA